MSVAEFGPGDVLDRLQLMPPVPGTAVGSELEILDVDTYFIRVADPTDNPRRPLERKFSLVRSNFILRYPIERDRAGWNVRIRYDDPPEIAEYAFWDRETVFRFQRLVTGYVPYAYCEDTCCDATIRESSLWRSNTVYHGKGEIQLWCSEELLARQVAPGACTTASLASFPRASISSGASAATSTTTMKTIHSPSKNTTSYVSQDRPPLLVAFLRDKDGFTMLRANSERPDPQHACQGYLLTLAVSDLMCTTSVAGAIEQVDLKSINCRTKGFESFKYSVSHDRINDWNVRTIVRCRGSRGLKRLELGDLCLKARATSNNTGPQKESLQEFQKRLTDLQSKYNSMKDDLKSRYSVPPQGIDPGRLPSTISTPTLRSPASIFARPQNPTAASVPRLPPLDQGGLLSEEADLYELLARPPELDSTQPLGSDSSRPFESGSTQIPELDSGQTSELDSGKTLELASTQGLSYNNNYI